MRAAKELFHFLYWLAHTYTRRAPGQYEGLTFDEAKVPVRQVSVSAQTSEQLKKLEEELRARDAQLVEQHNTLADTDAEIERLRKEIAEAKKQNQLIPDRHDYSEAETRAYFIDLLLHEAGWPLDKPEDREYPVTGMPNATGEGFVDYVLWGNNGKPLAVVEAKRTTKDPRIGQQQAKLYADCLEKQFHQRPLIFYTNGYKTWLWDDHHYPPREVQAMNTDNFIVRPHREQVEKYRQASAWDQLDADHFAEIAHILAGLPSERAPEDETAKRFDLMMLKLQLAVLNADKSFVRLRNQVQEIASRLEEKTNIPMVKEQMELLLDLQQEEYWADITLPMLEDIRRRLRDLVKFIDKQQRAVIYSDFQDEVGEVREVSPTWMASATGLAQYRKKVLHFLAEHQDHIAIHKLKRNLPITASDIAELERIFFASGELGTRADFEHAYGKQESLGLFIRKLVGLDREAAKEAFGAYLSRKTLTANQIRFLDQMIDYLTRNGVMDPGLLYESPFTDYSPKGLDGVFNDTDAEGIVSILHTIHQQAAA